MSAGRLRLLAGKRDAFKPTDIPRSLAYSVWDFEQTGRMTVAGGAISAFSDPITAASFSQATGANQPLLNATGFNSRQCSTYDGTDYLQNTTAIATLGWPASGAFEIWALLEYTGTVDGALHLVFSYPAAVNTSVSLSIVTTGGVAIARLRAGTGSASVAVDAPAVSFTSGRHIIRAVSTGTTIRLDVDGIVGTPVACVGAFSGTSRPTIGGASGSTSSGTFFIGNINFIGLHRPLPDACAAGLYRNLNLRKG